jgi:hypothetical protein
LFASDSLVSGATKLLERFRSEISLISKLETVPAYKLPPKEEDTSALNKKQLATFIGEYWASSDLGHLKETTEEDGCSAFPLAPGFSKSPEDDAWTNNPIKALINTPEGYIWVPSQALIGVREAARNLDVALIRATNLEANAVLVGQGRERLKKLELDIQQLELKVRVTFEQCSSACLGNLSELVVPTGRDRYGPRGSRCVQGSQEAQNKEEVGEPQRHLSFSCLPASVP